MTKMWRRDAGVQTSEGRGAMWNGKGDCEEEDKEIWEMWRSWKKLTATTPQPSRTTREVWSGVQERERERERERKAGKGREGRDPLLS
jgi:hypothetical protein